MMNVNLVFEHALIVILGCGVGISIGGIAGYVIATMMNRLYLSNKKLRNNIVFLPWRSVITGLLMFLHFPAYTAIKIGLGSRLGIINVGLYTTLLSIVLSCNVFIKNHIDHKGYQTIVWVRTLAVLSVLVTYHYGIFGGGGLGFIILQSINIFEYDVAVIGLIWMVILALIIDFLIGFVQFLSASRIRSSEKHDLYSAA